MMKNFKLLLLSFALIAGLFTSCSNEDSVVEDQNINETQAITESLNRLAQQFDDNGNVLLSENPSGNIVFDFGFDFVYPLNLSFNNGTTVAVNSLEDLIEILINSTDDLYVNGVEFPFDVEVYNDDTDAIEIVTINNEDEFFDLLESFSWDDQDTCECFEVYEPVCVEVTDPNGESFVISYPNECYALCDGFTSDDFVDNCEDDYNNTGGFECFEFNFPLTIITDNNQTITVDSQTELDNALYNAYYFDFVYPFNVTDDDGDVETIDDVEDLIDLLEDCYDYYEEECFIDFELLGELLQICDEIEIEMYTTGDGDLEDEFYASFNENGELIVNGEPTVVDTGLWEVSAINDDTYLTISGLQTFGILNGGWWLEECEESELLFSNGNYYLEVDLDCDDTVVEPCDCDDEFDPVCVEIEEGGQITVITFPNECYAECEGFTEADYVDCENNIPSSCSEQEVFAYLLQCEWYIATNLYNNVNSEYAEFSQSGDVTIYPEEGSGNGISGDWNLSSNPATGQVFMFLTFNDAPYDAISQLDWTVVECSEEFMFLVSGDSFISLERECD